MSTGDSTPPQQPQSYSIIHVNAVSGSDVSGDGSQLRPWQTVTHALQMAEANAVIILAPGVYSEASGENFPIRLRPGVTVQGSATPGINNAVIRGSGTFPSATGAYMQVTIIGADGAGLAHVTVTNSGSSGYGLVIESGSPIIRENHFIGSGYAGAYAAGTGAPLFEQNYFSENGSVGLVIAGQSRAEVQGNTFENTGTGIQVEPGAHPTIANNRIVSNRAGLVVAAEARPHLHDNEIFQNRQNGVVELAAANKTETSSPPPSLAAPIPLGDAADGASRASTVPTALGAQAPEVGQSTLEPPPQAGQVQQLASPPEVSRSTGQLASPPPVRAGHEAVATVPEEPTDHEPVNLALLSPPPEVPDLATQPSREELTTAVAPTADAASESDQAAARTQDLPLALPLATGLDISNDSQVQAVALDVQLSAAETVRATAATSEISARQPALGRHNPATSETAVPLQVIPPLVETIARAQGGPSEEDSSTLSESSAANMDELERVDRLPTLPAVDSNSADLLQVPDMTIPSGNGRYNVPVLATGSADTGVTAEATAGGPPAPPSRAATLGLFYRVLVPSTSEAVQNRVRELVPDAFRVEFEGKMMMQAGAYPTQEEAKATAERLQQQGLAAQVVYIP
jgi:hypothetical protein